MEEVQAETAPSAPQAGPSPLLGTPLLGTQNRLWGARRGPRAGFPTETYQVGGQSSAGTGC